MSPSIIHVARKLITRPIHCGFVNLFRRSGRVPLDTLLSPPTANLPRSFVRIGAKCLREYFISIARKTIGFFASPAEYYPSETGEKRASAFLTERGHFSFLPHRIYLKTQGGNLLSFASYACLVRERIKKWWGNCDKGIWCTGVEVYLLDKRIVCGINFYLETLHRRCRKTL